MTALVTAVRVFEGVVFLFAAGLSFAMALLLNTPPYRRALLCSFGLLCVATFVRGLQLMLDGAPWTAGSYIYAASALLAVVSCGLAWRERSR